MLMVIPENIPFKDVLKEIVSRGAINLFHFNASKLQFTNIKKRMIKIKKMFSNENNSGKFKDADASANLFQI